MSEVQLSVEVLAKMESLRDGLKRGSGYLNDFADNANLILGKLEQSLKGLGVNTSAQGLRNLSSAARDLAASSNQSTNALINQRTATEAQRTAAATSRAELAALRTANVANRAAIVAAAGSYDEAKQRLAALGREIRAAAGGFSATTPAIRAQIREYTSLNRSIQEYNAEMLNRQGNVGNYNGVIGEIQGVAAAYMSAYAVIGGVKKLISSNAEFADSLSDVQRTAGLTAKEADALGESLKRIDTRTALNDLAGIATIGGQMGIAKDELGGFTKAVDMLAVTLKGEIKGGAEEVASSLGKINGVFKVQEKEGTNVETSLNKTGSAILRLGQIGLATGEFLQDFALRTAGVAQVAKIGLPTMLAYGATLEEAGISAEVAGTAVVRLMSSLSSKRAEFFAIAKLGDANLTLKKFTDLINTDAQSALSKFFVGLKAGNPTMTEFSDRLDTIKLKAGPSKNAIIALAENQAKLTERVVEGSKAYNDGTLATDQYAIKNTNLASAIGKLGNTIANSFISSELSRSLAGVIDGMVSGKTEAEKLTDAYRANKEESQRLDDQMKPLLQRYDSLQEKANSSGGAISLNKDEQEELRRVTAEIGNLMPGVIKRFDSYGNALDINRDKVNQMTKAQKELLALQNKSAIRKANNEFDDLSITTRQYEKAAQIAIAKGYDSTSFSDSAKLIAGKAYEAAKAVRDLGGELTELQQQSIDYFEKKPNRSSKTESKNNPAIALTDDKPDKKSQRIFDTVEKQLQDFHNKANIITKEGLAKDLQEWDDKYGKIKSAIDKLPAGEKKTKATATLETQYKDGRANIIEASSKKITEAIKKRNEAINAADLDGMAKEIQTVNANYDEQVRLAEGNRDGIIALRKQQADEISKIERDHAVADTNTIVKQMADVAQAYRVHKAEMFTLGKTKGLVAVEISENERAKEELKRIYTDRLIDFEEYQLKMAELIDKGNQLEIKLPVFDVKHFEDVATQAQKSVNDILQNFVDSGMAAVLSDAFSSVGQAIVEGGSVIAAAGKAMRASFAELMKALGQQYISMGAAKMVAGVLMSPFGLKEVGQGAALMALGASLSVGSGMLSASGGGKNTDKGLPKFAMGVENFGGGMAIVGERGPEIVNMPTGSHVIPNHKVLQGIAGGGGNPTFVIRNEIEMGKLVIAIEKQQRTNSRIS